MITLDNSATPRPAYASWLPQVLTLFVFGLIACGFIYYRGDLEKLGQIGSYVGGTLSACALVYVAFTHSLQRQEVANQFREMQLGVKAQQDMAKNAEHAQQLQLALETFKAVNRTIEELTTRAPTSGSSVARTLSYLRSVETLLKWVDVTFEGSRDLAVIKMYALSFYQAKKPVLEKVRESLGKPQRSMRQYDDQKLIGLKLDTLDRAVHNNQPVDYTEILSIDEYGLNQEERHEMERLIKFVLVQNGVSVAFNELGAYIVRDLETQMISVCNLTIAIEDKINALTPGDIEVYVNSLSNLLDKPIKHANRR